MKGKLAGQADENEMFKIKIWLLLVTNHKTSLNTENATAADEGEVGGAS